MEDRRPAVGPNSGYSHNDLSGRAHTVAQVHTVNGGVHVHSYSHRPSPSTFEKNSISPKIWLTVGITLLVLAAATAVVSFYPEPHISNSQAKPINNNTPPSLNPDGNMTSTPYRIRGQLPKGYIEGRQQYWESVPEATQVYSFQIYRCAGQIYRRALIGIAQIPISTSDLGLVARGFSANFMAVAWSGNPLLNFSTQKNAVAGSADGTAAYFGTEFDGRFQTASTTSCTVNQGELKCRVLVYHNTYLIILVVATLDGPPQYGGQLTDQDVQNLVDDVVPY
jgi:hypothetical protein